MEKKKRLIYHFLTKVTEFFKERKEVKICYNNQYIYYCNLSFSLNHPTFGKKKLERNWLVFNLPFHFFLPFKNLGNKLEKIIKYKSFPFSPKLNSETRCKRYDYPFMHSYILPFLNPVLPQLVLEHKFLKLQVLFDLTYFPSTSTQILI